MNHRPSVYLTGPTAVGKSAVALVLAQRLDGEIISVDSMQVYRGLDLGTAKPGPGERARVPHHLIDVVELSESFDVARFVGLAAAAAASIRGRGGVPIFCGGSGLYLKAWFEGLGTAPSANPALRKDLEATPLVTLLAELAQQDPLTYEQIDRQNPRRVIRALEVIRLTGRPFSAQRAAWGPGSASPLAAAPDWLFALRRTPADLRRRVEARVDAMFSGGLLAETRLALTHGLAQNPTAMQGIGYRQAVEHLRGERDLAATIALVKSRTWQYVRRQMTWFRHQLAVRWLDIDEAGAAEETADRICQQLTAAPGPAHSRS